MPRQSSQVAQPRAPAPHPASGLEARAALEGLPALCGGAAGEGAGVRRAADTWVDGCFICFGDALTSVIILMLINSTDKCRALL